MIRTECLIEAFRDTGVRKRLRISRRDRVRAVTCFDPPKSCTRCPRLAGFRRENRTLYPDFHNAPVGLWGDRDAPLLIVGLAPGLKGANRTGRPFTGDASGALLFASLLRIGFASRNNAQSGGGGTMSLHNCAITNAVACVPPKNRPTAQELSNCRPYLAAQLKAPEVVLALGRVAQEAVLKVSGQKPCEYPFGHGAAYRIGAQILICSFHPSRYNVATKRINEAMMDEVLMLCKKKLEAVQAGPSAE